MAKQNIHDKKKMNPILWFLFAIVIPVIVAVTITIVVLMIAGVDVMGWAKHNVPGVSSLMAEDSSDQEKDDSKLNLTVTKKDEEIESLKDKVASLENEKDDLELEIVKLKNKQKSNDNAESKNDSSSTAKQGEADDKDSEVKSSVKSMASSFRKIDPKQAALIIQDLDKDMALDVL